MAKALKVVGLVVAAVGIGLATAGFGAVAITGAITATISTTAIVGAGLALEVGAALLSKKGSTTTSQTDRLSTSLDPRAPRKTWLGVTAGGNDLRYEEWFGAAQEYCGWVIALASHRIDGLDQIWINQEMVWSAGTGVAAKYQGYFYVQDIVLEGSPSNTVRISNPDARKWNTSSRLTGCAYVHIQFRVTGVNSKATSPFSGSLPSRLTFIGRGSPVYDPRRDGSLSGGAGAMRADDQSTWRFTSDDGAAIGSNIPLQILRVLLGWRITNPTTGATKLAVGCGLPARRIDLASFAIAAGIADELANRSAGGTEPKFHGGALLSEGDDAHSQLDMLCAACNGRLRDVNGKLALVIMHDDLADAATDDGLDDNDVIGAFTWDSDPPLDQCVNVVRGRYTDPSTTSLYQMIDYPDVSLPSPDGIDRVMTLDLSVAQSPSHAQRVAKQVLERRQYQRTFTAPFDIRAWKYQVGDVVPFTFSALSFARRLFRVSAQELGQDGQCVMSLMDENEAIYAWDASDAPAVVAAAPIVYDPTRSPLVLAIGEAAASANWSQVTNDDGGRPQDGATRNVPRGAWVANIAYSQGDIVTYGGASYIAGEAVPAGVYPTNTAYWDALASGGSTGPQGPKGNDGATGPAGPQGIAGTSGTNGQPAFFHVAYANSADGSQDFIAGQANPGRSYIGVYSDAVQAGSTDYHAYNWSRLTGQNGTNGTNGTPGPVGPNGQASYVHFAYADSLDGRTNFTTGDPGTRTYIGVYSDFSLPDSNDPTAYAWSLIKGADGATGATGAPGLQGNNGLNGADGASVFTFTDLQNCGIRTQTTITKAVGGDAWNGKCRTNETYTAATVSAKLPPGTFVGLDNRPEDTNDYQSLDLAWHRSDDGNDYIVFYAGGLQFFNAGPTTGNYLYTVSWDGKTATYIRAGQIVATRTLSYNPGSLCGTFCIFHQGATIGAIAFAPGGLAGNDGATGSPGATGATGSPGGVGPPGQAGVSPSPAYPAVAVTGTGTFAYGSPVPLAPGQTLTGTAYIGASVGNATATVTLQVQYSIDGGGSWNALATDQESIDANSGVGLLAQGPYTNQSGSRMLVYLRAVLARSGASPTFQGGYLQPS